MALFLSESADLALAPQHNITFQEAYEGLLEAVAVQGELNEAILTADFIIHEQTRGLEESVQLQEETGFFSRVAANVVEMVKKVRDHVVAFFKRIGEGLKTLWAKLTGKGGQGEAPTSIQVPKNGAKGLADVGSALDKFKGVVDGNKDDAKAYKRSVADGYKEFDKVATGAKKAISDAKATKSYETVAVSALNKIQGLANEILATASQAQGVLAKEVTEAEKAKTKAQAASTKASAAVAAAGGAKNASDKKVDKADDAKEGVASAKKALDRAREVSGAYTKLAQAAAAVNSTVHSVIAGRAKADAKA